MIRSLDIRLFTERVLKEVPDYFWNIPASATGKYHPKFSLGHGGLVRHTKATVRIAVELFKVNFIGGMFTQRNKDIIICSLLFHDCMKCGYPKTEYTLTEHPLLASKFLKNHFQNDLDLPTFYTICACVEKHMGQWNFNFKTKEEVLELPEREIEKFVHLCDYLASRKCIEINFDTDMKY